MKDEGLRKKLGKSARETVEANYSLNSVVRMELEFLRKVMES